MMQRSMLALNDKIPSHFAFRDELIIGVSTKPAISSCIRAWSKSCTGFSQNDAHYLNTQVFEGSPSETMQIIASWITTHCHLLLTLSLLPSQQPVRRTTTMFRLPLVPYTQHLWRPNRSWSETLRTAHPVS